MPLERRRRLRQGEQHLGAEMQMELMNNICVTENIRQQEMLSIFQSALLMPPKLTVSQLKFTSILWGCF
jgi:hypothetical protein